MSYWKTSSSGHYRQAGDSVMRTMKKINPEIIFGSITGFGQTGPLRRANTAYDNVIECMSGFMEMTGYSDGIPAASLRSFGRPTAIQASQWRLQSALACYDKKRTGKGRRTRCCLCWIRCLRLSRMQCWHMRLTGKEISRTGNAKPREIVPYDTY